jgi:hypothetical protein
MNKYYIFIVAFIIALVASVSWAGEVITATGTAIETEPSVKYEVTFEIKYNSLTAEEAKDLVGTLLLEHAEACKVKVDIKKNGGEDEGVVSWDEISPGLIMSN